MGKKTDKKVKSERINVLRKQYEAYLEEDKKRKDRNDYILGRLDKMRYSSTAVQLRHTPNTCSDYFAPAYDHSTKSDNVERNNMQIVHVNQFKTRPGHGLQPNVPTNYIGETSLLKEISKKYILIPKLRTTFPQYDVPEVIPPLASAPVPSEKPNDIDNDWKSKYDILEQLKKDEQQEEINKYANKDLNLNNKESTIKNNLNNIIHDSDHVMMQNYTKDEVPTRYEEEIPEKDISDQLEVENELKGLEKCTINNDINQIPTTDVANLPSTLFMNPENAAPYYDQIQNEVYEPQGAEVNAQVEDYEQPIQYIIPEQQKVKAVSHIDNQYQENYPKQELQPQQEYPIEYDQFIPSAEVDTNQPEHEVFHQEENDYSPIEVINPGNLENETKKDVIQKVIESNEYPSEIANTQELTPEEPVVLQDVQGIIPESYMTEDGTIVQSNPGPQKLTDDPTDNTGIEEFDAEQREMFYSEQTDQNYAYDEQGAAGDAYNAGYVQNQNYPQNQEYAYYEGAEQEEGTYPAEINEHEETQQLYDQHYEQQYATNYEEGFEQPPIYMEQDPTQPQFEQPALYDTAQQEFEQYAYDQVTAETQEQEEKILDREDGYTEKQADDPSQKVKQSAELHTP